MVLYNHRIHYFLLDIEKKEVAFMLKKKGFTLIELIIVLAIIGILGAILTPSIMAYVNRAKKKATVANGRTIYLSALHALTTSDAAYDSFYSQSDRTKFTYYEATEEGGIVLCSYTYDKTQRTDVYSERIDYRNQKLRGEGNYLITVVARVDGIPHTKGGDWKDPTNITRIMNTWSQSDKAYNPYLQELAKDLAVKANVEKDGTFYVKMPYRKREDGGTLPLIRWLVVYRVEDLSKVEVWAGDGYKGENGPAYRVYPNPSINYA